MRLCIAGSRTLEPSYNFIHSSILMFGITDITEVVSGACNGVDQEGEHWASHYGAKVKRFPIEKEDWINKGKSAGPIRNKKMADYADALLLIWDGQSRGSANMKSLMEKANKPVYEIILKCPGEFDL